MKKLFFLFAFLGVFSLAANAQSCPYSKTAAKSDKVVCSKTAAAKAASLDNSIEARTCAKSGSVSYVKKSVCAKSGKVSYSDVEYCTKSAKFVNVSPKAMGAKKSCDPAACAKGKTVSNKKSCDPAACMKSQTKGAKVKAVKVAEQ